VSGLLLPSLLGEKVSISRDGEVSPGRGDDGVDGFCCGRRGEVGRGEVVTADFGVRGGACTGRTDDPVPTGRRPGPEAEDIRRRK
jgi:hypothetical protein